MAPSFLIYLVEYQESIYLATVGLAWSVTDLNALSTKTNTNMIICNVHHPYPHSSMGANMSGFQIHFCYKKNMHICQQIPILLSLVRPDQG